MLSRGMSHRSNDGWLYTVLTIMLYCAYKMGTFIWYAI